MTEKTTMTDGLNIQELQQVAQLGVMAQKRLTQFRCYAGLRSNITGDFCQLDEVTFLAATSAEAAKMKYIQGHPYLLKDLETPLGTWEVVVTKI